MHLSATPGLQGRATLCQRLRDDTRALHDQVEAATGLPGSIRSRSGYLACLRRFHGLYRPLFAQVLAFPDWPGAMGAAPRDLAERLAADLAALDPYTPLPPAAPACALPDLPRFAHALGALYVVEGATLGGTVILRCLRAAGVEGVADASHFFGAVDAAAWQAARAAIERFADTHPAETSAVIAGAQRTFAAVGDWMDLNRWGSQ